jgi:hypothetical protein
LKQRELSCSDQFGPADKRRLSRRRVEAELSIAQKRRRAAALSAEHGAHPCQQFADLERFDQIVIRAEIEPIDALIDAIPSSNDDDGEPAAERTQAPKDIPTVRLRQPLAGTVCLGAVRDNPSPKALLSRQGHVSPFGRNPLWYAKGSKAPRIQGCPSLHR